MTHEQQLSRNYALSHTQYDLREQNIAEKSFYAGLMYSKTGGTSDANAMLDEHLRIGQETEHKDLLSEQNVGVGTLKPNQDQQSSDEDKGVQAPLTDTPDVPQPHKYDTKTAKEKGKKVPVK